MSVVVDVMVVDPEVLRTAHLNTTGTWIIPQSIPKLLKYSVECIDFDFLKKSLKLFM